MSLATQLRVPRQQWAYVATPEMLMGARSSLVLIDEATIGNHPMAKPIAEALSDLHARGAVVIASLASSPPIQFRD